MIGIGSADIYIDTPKLSREELEEYSKTLFEQWEVYVDIHLELSDYSLSLSVEDGSIKAYGKIALASLSALYIGIGQYGSFMSGVQTIKGQVSDASEYLGQQAVRPFAEERISPTVRKRGEALSRLEGIFKKVEAGEITVEEAVAQSKALLGEDENVPDFYNDLENSLAEIPPHPQEEQLELDIPVEEAVAAEIKSLEKRNKSPRPPRDPEDHYRVIIWRDSKDDRVKVEVTKK
ncbi:hypothetical protein [Neptuniibacter sp. 2_MG-2023]|uniref:hypothetical protein n=1 Tax=Neptuniibacter sp. 2_MG-2023 TaxID=3062671 RepID=UPI0026E2EF80|nr:hypothetical protein [Neptuniibacter sp. 2_MG-2023]MDO6514610.1 hypothetical protein [Neptuniibacter sp. 2_MG-2023]